MKTEGSDQWGPSQPVTFSEGFRIFQFKGLRDIKRAQIDKTKTGSVSDTYEPTHQHAERLQHAIYRMIIFW